MAVGWLIRIWAPVLMISCSLTTIVICAREGKIDSIVCVLLIKNVGMIVTWVCRVLLSSFRLSPEAGSRTYVCHGLELSLLYYKCKLRNHALLTVP